MAVCNNQSPPPFFFYRFTNFDHLIIVIINVSIFGSLPAILKKRMDESNTEVYKLHGGEF